METSLVSSNEEEEIHHGHFLSGSRLLKQFRTWRDSKQTELQHQKDYWRYYDGDPWTEDELNVFRQRNQPPTYYNEVRRKINGIVGVEEQMRRDPKGVARNPNPGDENAASVVTKSVRFVCDNNRLEKLSPEVLKNGEIAGLSGIRFDVDSEAEEITFDTIDEANTFYDPNSKKTDFSDAKYLGTWDWVDKEDAKELIGGNEEMIDIIFDAYASGNHSEAPEELDKGRESWVNTKEDTVFLIEHWYKARGVWHCAYHCGGIVLKQWVSPLSDKNGNSIHMFELWSPNIKKSDGHRYGTVKDMIPIQDAINKRASKLLHMLNTRQTKARAGAIEDVDEMKRELHRPDGHIEIQGDGDFDIINNNDQIAGQSQILQYDLAQMDRTGPNNALIGRGTERQSGVAIQEQKHSGITELSPELQEFRDWKLRVYRKIWLMCRLFWTKERFIRVTDNKGAPEFIGLNQEVIDEATGQTILNNQIAELDVDIILDEGPDTLTVQQEDFKILSELMPFMRESGQQIPAKVLFQASPIRNKEEIISALQEQDEAARNQGPDPIIMKEMALKHKELEAKIEQIISEIKLNQAKQIKEIKQAEKIDLENEVTEAELNSPPIVQEFVDPMALQSTVYEPSAYEGIDYQ